VYTHASTGLKLGSISLRLMDVIFMLNFPNIPLNRRLYF
jgi:hypothetical protein